MKIAIRGLSASGKGTVARLVATRLGIPHVDIGQLFRFLTYVSMVGVDWSEVALVVEGPGVRFFCENARIPVERLSTEDLALRVAKNAENPAWFKSATKKINAFLYGLNSVVVDGRNAGTVFLPKAKYKFELVAPLSDRAFRRFNQLIDSGVQTTLGEVESQLAERDRIDLSRLHFGSIQSGRGDFIKISNPIGVKVEQLVDSVIASIQCT